MHLQWIDSIQAIQATDWNALFPSDYPFCRHEFLQALETGRSVGAGTGWLPQHLLVWQDGRLVAAAPAYLKLHSFGEYLFDRVFAEAYQRFGLRYYPKLVFAIPFTPAEGPRVGFAQGVDPAAVLALVSQQLQQFGYALAARSAAPVQPGQTLQTEQTVQPLQTVQLSHWQCLYPDPALQHQLQAAGWLKRTDVQFEWQNRCPAIAACASESSVESDPSASKRYQDFEQFLAVLTARKRKQIRKERAVVQQQGLQLRTLTGDMLHADFWPQFYQFYVATYRKRSGHSGYLSLATLQQWGQRMAAQIVVFSAWSGAEMVAASLCFRSQDKLYGRYWGCLDHYSMLHFECCYYSGIDYCIQHGLDAFDAGAQGEHKLQRGFIPQIRTGFYYFPPVQESAEQAPDPTQAMLANLHSAIARYCLEEQQMVLQYQQQADSVLPFASRGSSLTTMQNCTTDATTNWGA